MFGSTPTRPKEISVHELKDQLASSSPPLLLDVRNPSEFEFCSIKGATLIPLSQLMTRAGELPKDRSIVVYCHHGMRSLQGAAVLLQQGFSQVVSLRGGIDEWSIEIDPSVKTY